MGFAFNIGILILSIMVTSLMNEKFVNVIGYVVTFLLINAVLYYLFGDDDASTNDEEKR